MQGGFEADILHAVALHVSQATASMH